MPAFRDLPIKRKLLAVTMVTAGAALLLSGVAIVGADSILFRRALARDISALARIVADNSTASLAFEDPQSASETLAALHVRTHIVTACVFRQDGSVLARYSRPGASSACPPASTPAGERFASGDLTSALPILLNGRRIGGLALVYDLDEIAERRRLYGSVVLGVLLAASLVAFLVSSKLQGAIATPVMQLANAAAAVSQTRDYGIRATKFSEDELGLLVDAFNEMLDGIQFRDTELLNALLTRESALREAQQTRDSLETTLASIGDAVISTDTNGRVVFVNRVALSLLRRPEEEVKGRLLGDVVTVIDEITRERVQSSAGAGNQAVLVAKDGAETPVDQSVASIRRENGPIQGIVLVFRDVTARRRADETARLLASIVESSGDAIIAKDLNGIVTSWNRGAETIFGYSAAEMVGKPISVLAAPGHENEMSAILGRVRQGERVEHFVTLRRTRAGRLINVSLTVSPLYDALGRIVGASKIARNITGTVQAAERLAQLNADLRQSNEDLARSNEDLERFAFVASHDLQEPLRMITVYLQLLVQSSGAAFDQQATGFVDNIVNGAKRMRELLADLLAYLEVGSRSEETVEIVDLNQLLLTVKENLKASIHENNGTVTWDDLPQINANPGHFVSLFQNLIENALKYRGPDAPRIHISTGGDDGQLRFAIADNGIGIEPEYHDRIFVAFKRLHGKAIPGTGIGLAICQRVVERYGGRIRVDSEFGRGSTFSFSFPENLRVSGVLQGGKSRGQENK